jgi:hypothetical protein
MTLNANSLLEVKGIAAINNYAGAANDPARVQLLIDTIQPYATANQRGMLDQMSPAARIQLLVELQALFTAVT